MKESGWPFGNRPAAKRLWALLTRKHILDEKIRTKLLAVPDPLKIALVTRGQLDVGFKKIGEDGWTLVRCALGTRHRKGSIRLRISCQVSSVKRVRP